MGNKNGAATNAPEDSNNNNPEVKTETAENLPLTRCTSNSRQKGGSSSKARKAASNSFRKEQDRRNGEENDDGDGRSYKRRREYSVFYILLKNYREKVKKLFTSCENFP